MGDLLRMPLESLQGFVRFLGQIALLARELFESLLKGRKYPRLVGEQICSIGYGSQAVIIVTGAFTGAVLTAQSYFKFKDFGMESTIGAVVSVAMCRELGPVLTGLMLSGRVGAAMAAEIGTMKVTEQIDALRSMSVHTIDYLVSPRLVAMMISIPLLIAEAIVFGILASYIVATQVFGVEASWFMAHVEQHTEFHDIFIGMLKGFCFGILITLISCHQGLNARNGAVGVGQGTTRAMVYSSLALLVFNFFLTFLMNYFFPLGTG